MRTETAELQRLRREVTAALANRSAAEAIDALRPLNDARSSCLLIARADAGGVPSIVVWDTRTYGPGLVAFLDGSGWRVSAFPLPDGSNGNDAFLWREARVLRDGDDVLLLATVYAAPVCRAGCGGVGPGFNQGWIALYRLSDAPALLARSTGGEGYASRISSNDRVVESTLASPDPDPVHSRVSPVANRPWQSLQQTLWERRGTTLVRTASRLYPSPIRALDVFIGALEARDRVTALRFAVDPSTYDAWRGDPIELSALEAPIDLVRVDDLEAAFWDALPRDERGPVPPTTVSASSAGYRITLSRVAGEWKVASLVRR